MSSPIQQPIGIVERPAPTLRVVARLATPQILRVDRYRLTPGTLTPIQHLQQRAALVMAQWGCPHPYLAVESVTGPAEVWRLTGYQTAADQRRAALSMDMNPALRGDLERIESQIQVLAGPSYTWIAQYVGGILHGQKWPMGRGQYLVIAPVSGSADPQGAPYQASDGAQYAIASARTRKGAESRAAAAGPGAYVFAVRPAWSMPAAEWVRCNPAFWSSSPAVKSAR
jgi:hypothetical protein